MTAPLESPEMLVHLGVDAVSRVFPSRLCWMLQGAGMLENVRPDPDGWSPAGWRWRLREDVTLEQARAAALLILATGDGL